MEYILIDNRMRNIEKNTLKYLGYKLVPIEKSNNVYPEISSHVDIFTTKIGDTLVVEKSKYEDLAFMLKDSEYNNYFKKLDNIDVRIAVEAERSFMKELNGGCHSLIGAYARLQGNDIYIIGTYEVNGIIIKKDILGNKEDYVELGKKLAQKILRA